MVGKHYPLIKVYTAYGRRVAIDIPYSAMFTIICAHTLSDCTTMGVVLSSVALLWVITIVFIPTMWGTYTINGC